MVKRIIVLTISILVGGALWGGREFLHSGRAEILPIKTYSATDGLTQNHVSRIVFDSRGFIWICTNEGLSRFDGYRFTNFGVAQGLPNRTVNDLIETPDGEYWVATNGGLVRFNPLGQPGDADKMKDGQAAMFTLQAAPTGDKGYHYHDLALGKNGEIWCGSQVGLFRLTKNSQGQYVMETTALLSTGNQNYFVRSLAIDRHGVVWAGSDEGQIFRLFPGGNLDRHVVVQTSTKIEVSKMFEDQSGRIWAGTGGGLFELATSPDNDRPFIKQHLRMPQGLPGDWVRDIWQGSDGTFWVATDRGLGKYRLDENGHFASAVNYTMQNGLSDYYLKCVIGDPWGNVWLGSANAGIMKLSFSGFTTYGFRDGFVAASSIFENRQGDVFLAGYVPIVSPIREPANPEIQVSSAYLQMRLGRLSRGRFVWIRPNMPPSTYFTSGWKQISFQDSRREWWMATEVGLYRFPATDRLEDLATLRPSAVYTTRDGLQNNYINRLFEDSRGDIWIVGVNKAPPSSKDPQDTKVLNSLDRWDRATGRFVNISHPDGAPRLMNRPINVFCEDRQGNVWMGLNRQDGPGGLARYRDGVITNLTENDGAPNSNVNDLLLDSAGRLWIATTDQGVFRLDDPYSSTLRFTVYNTNNQLFSNRIASLAEDSQGRIYVGTGKGIDQLEPESGRVRHYGSADGLALGNVDDLHRDRQGNLWVATTLGLSTFIPQTDPPSIPPPIYIDGIKINGQPYPISARGETEVILPPLHHTQNQIEIDYVGISHAPGDTLRYEVKLVGADGNWQDLLYQRSINYANLAPGEYKLFVQALNARKDPSPSPACVSFTIAKPFWQKWWFFVLVAVFLIGLGAMLNRIRVAQQLRMYRVRARLAHDLHDQVGSSLSQIAILSEVARRQPRNQAENGQADLLEKVALTSREAIESMSDIVWSITPQRDHLRDLVQRMRRFASDTLSSVDINLFFEAPDEDLALDVDLRREVFLIFKESINNIARHSQATEAGVELAISTHHLTLRIWDNGRGFSEQSLPPLPKGGTGLPSMRQRAENLRGSLDVSSAPNQGTTLTLRLPLRKRKRI